MSVQDEINKLRDQYHVGAVAAQNVVDPNNAAWVALRAAAKARHNVYNESDQHMILKLDQSTGETSLVLSSAGRQVTLPGQTSPVVIYPPRVFYGNAASAWVELHSDPDKVRFLIVKAVTDKLYPKVDTRQVPTKEVRDSILVNAGFVYDATLEAWAGAAVTFAETYIAQATFGELRKLLFGE